MSDRKINPQILGKIKENSKGDTIVGDFLIDLIYAEVEHTSGWWWKRVYKEKVKSYAQKWEGADAG